MIGYETLLFLFNFFGGGGGWIEVLMIETNSPFGDEQSLA